MERQIQRQKLRLITFDKTLDGWSGKVRRTWRLRRGRRYRTYLNAEIKAKNVMKDIHYKVAHYLCANYRSIFMPWTNSSSLMQGTLHKSTKRALSHLRWGNFRSRLSETASLYQYGLGAKHILQSSVECVERSNNLGASELFKCSAACGFRADRDVHAAL